eukprot:CAMPEP_0172812932 /NCGR_PEP_ID=MMETSP1075-20121228/10340_1 /TAXON_ID=2916 /ORGANISM="Ceratium fusus, Strain PA161109" /LENGTH=480 /DNA_ID=CAMNT_0013652545 /DNA_START=38 /DNA_END=1480 /DNA_ORIENTATION=+
MPQKPSPEGAKPISLELPGLKVTKENDSAGRTRFYMYPTKQEAEEQEDGKVVRPFFSKAEFDHRLSKVRAMMLEEGLDAVVLTSMHNIKYFTNFLYCPFGRSYAVVITKDEVVMSTAGTDQQQPRRDEIYGIRNYVYTDWNKQNYLEVLRKEIGHFTKIGYEADHMNCQLFEEMKAYCFSSSADSATTPSSPSSSSGGGEEPAAKRAKTTTGSSDSSLLKFTNVSKLLMKQRLVKTEQEVELIREACKVANQGCDATIAAMKEGVKEWKVAEAGLQKMNELISEKFPASEMRDTWVWFQSGINTDGAHNALTSKPLRKEDLLSFNMFPMIDGYYAALERTGYFGNHISEQHLKYWNVNVEVFEKGREMLQPGKKLGDIAKELNKIYEREGCLEYRTFGYGHSLGIMCHYYGRETILELREDNEMILEPGMVVSMEPHITVPENLPGAGGYREHDILLITETGNENLTNFKYGSKDMIFKV